METKPTPPESDDETTSGGWEHEPSRLSRLGGSLLGRLRIEAWSRLPADPSRFAEKPVAAIVEYPHGFELCDPPELGWGRSSAGIPPRTDGTRPRAV